MLVVSFNLNSFGLMKTFDVAVIGSGPSGAMAAYHLAKNGISTVIIEKEVLPRYKTCGGGLVHRGKIRLPFDVSAAIECEFREIDTYFGKKNLKMTSQRDVPVISMVMRDTFDHLIIQHAVEQGATLLQNHKVTGLEFNENIAIQTSEGIVNTKFIIAADGALGPTAKLAGWKETRFLMPALEYEVEVSPADFERLSQRVRFDIDAMPAGYGWCFPKKNHLSIGVVVLNKSKSDLNLKAYYAAYLKTLGIESVVSEEAHGFVIPVSPRTDTFVQKNVFLTGDAAGFADPIVAEGLSNAIITGIYAAEALIESKLDPQLAEQFYNEKLNQNVLPEVRTGVQLAKMFYEKKSLRNLFITRFGQFFVEAMTDLFMGKRTYPRDYKQALKNKFKKVFF